MEEINLDYESSKPGIYTSIFVICLMIMGSYETHDPRTIMLVLVMMLAPVIIAMRILYVIRKLYSSDEN
jgi:hypothetical protein